MQSTVLMYFSIAMRSASGSNLLFFAGSEDPSSSNVTSSGSASSLGRATCPDPESLAQVVRFELVLRQHAGTNPASDFLLLCQEILQVGIGLGVANLDLLVGFVPAEDSAFFRALKFA